MNQLLHSQNSIYWHICGSDKTRPSFFSPAFTNIKPRANGRNFVPQQLPTLLDVTCCVRLHTLLHVVAQSLKAVKLLHGSSNIVGATHALYTWSPQLEVTKSYGFYPSHDALQVLTLFGVVASVCTPLPTRTQQLQHFWPNKFGSCCVRLPLALD